MIYYSNSPLDTPHMTFIGRWTPFHKGHAAIIMKKIAEKPKSPVLILIRNTKEDQYSPSARAQYVKIWMITNNIQGTIMIIPNIEGVYWGRGVGYHTGLIDVDAHTTAISGTSIRKNMSDKGKHWQSLVAHKNDAYLLSKNISNIIEHGLVVWLTGCPSSGKTTIAKDLIRIISSQYPHLKTQLLDGDEMRASPLAHQVGFAPKERADHIIRMAHLAGMFASHGILTVCAFVSPDRKIRNLAKKNIGNKRYIEVYVKATKATRLKRDAKGMYKRAVAGKINNFTGYNAPYQVPLKPHIICDTDQETVAQCVEKIAVYVFNRHKL